MIKLSISAELAALWPDTALGALLYEADVAPSSPELLALFDEAVAKLSREYTLEAVAKNRRVAATRRAYKALGKPPQEYRCASEAMLRRIAKGSGLYHINNVVEINNLISVSSGYAIGSYDTGALRGAVELRRAEEGAHYGGIGKSSVNIGHLPVLCDEEGPFGNPSSDSRRAMIQPGRREVLSVIYAFDGGEDLDGWLADYARELERHCGVRGVDKRIIRPTGGEN